MTLNTSNRKFSLKVPGEITRSTGVDSLFVLRRSKGSTYSEIRSFVFTELLIVGHPLNELRGRRHFLRVSSV